MKKLVFILILMICAPAGFVYSQQAESGPGLREYTVQEIMLLALERAEKIKISEEDLYIAEMNRDKARSVLLPTMSAFGNFTRYSENKMSSSGFSIQPKHTESWGLRLDQSLSLSGREFTAFRMARESVEESRFNLYSVQEEYLLSVASAAYGFMKADKSLDIASSNVQRLRKHRDAAKVMLKVGEVTKTALLRAEAELAGAESELIAAENGRALAKTVLARTAGIEEDFSLRQTGNSVQNMFGGIENLPLASLIELARAERSDLKAADLQKKIAGDEVSYRKGSYWPDLSVEGVYSRSQNEPSSSFEIRERIYGGLKLDFPFFEGGLTRAEVKEAEAGLRQSQLAYEDILKSIDVEVEDAYLNFATRKGVLKSLEDRLSFARDNYNVVSKQFQYGLADSIDVMDANTLLVTAERELSNAEYDYYLSILKIRRATGTLLKAVIGQIQKDKIKEK